MSDFTPQIPKLLCNIMARKNHHCKNMNTSFTSSTSIKQPTSYFHVLQGLNEDESIEETPFESKISDEETVDVKEEPLHLLKSTGLDSNSLGLPVVDDQDDDKNSLLFESSFPPYDPVTNYLSPRPKFLKYNPDRHLKIVARQQELARILDHSVEETEEIVEESVANREEHEEEEEGFDEFEDDNVSSLKVFLKYMVVMVVLMLMTLTISSMNMNSPRVSFTESIHGFNVSETEGEAFSHVMLMARYVNDKEIDKGYKKRDQNEFDAMQHEQPADVCEDDEVGDLETVETVNNNAIDFDNHEPMIPTNETIESYRVEDENEAYILLLGAADLDSSDVNEESEILKPVTDKADSNKISNGNENEIEGKENAYNVTKMEYFDPFFAAYSAIAAVVIFACTSALYRSMQTEIDHINEASDGSCSKSSRFSAYHEINNDASSSNQTKYFDFQKSTADSPIEKKIAKKQQRSRTSEVISTVRRSSRIHNRSISSA